MIAVSLLQPWAELVVCGAKKFETRSWHTNYKGTLLIHASLKFSMDERELCEEEPFKSALTRPMAFGAIIGMVEMEGCYSTKVIRPTVAYPETSFGDFGPGRFAWKFNNPRRFANALPWKGQLSLWTFNGWCHKDPNSDLWILNQNLE